MASAVRFSLVLLVIQAAVAQNKSHDKSLGGRPNKQIHSEEAEVHSQNELDAKLSGSSPLIHRGETDSVATDKEADETVQHLFANREMPKEKKTSSASAPFSDLSHPIRVEDENTSELGTSEPTRNNRSNREEDQKINRNPIANTSFKNCTNDIVVQRKRRTIRRRHYQISDSAPHFRFTPIEQTVSPGAPVSLKCSVVGSPTPIISWMRDGVHLIPSLRTRLGSFHSERGEVVSYVNISESTSRDSGLFQCTAENALGLISASSRLNVYGPPFIRPMLNVSAVAGEDTTIRCPVGGFPIPTILWKHNDQSLPLDLRQEILQNHTLIIRNVKQGDQGRYTCVAEGRRGQADMAHTYLHIINPPRIEKFDFSDDLHEGQRTQLTCMVTTGDLPISIQWLKDDRHLPHDPDLEQKLISDYYMVLLFKQLSERHSGKYTCVAVNSAASVNQSATLKVKVPPKWVVSPSDVRVSVGKDILLECAARGVPDPNVQWMVSASEETRDFQRILDGHRIAHWKNGTLTISDIRKADSGLYLCQASNGIASPISKIVKVSVSASPEIQSAGGRVMGHSGRSIRLECESKGDAPLVINWLANHKPITESQRITISRSRGSGDSFKSILTLHDLKTSDGGQHQCNAVNEHGRDTRNFDLLVLEPPMAPVNIEVIEIRSRSVEIAWTVPQPSAVTLQYKEASMESWADDARNVSVGKEDLKTVLQSLTPFSKYSMRLFASNELGSSAPSKVISFTTLEEAPSGSPRDIRVSSLAPATLHVAWRPPLESSINGIIRGYIIALRRQDIRGDFQYITRPAMVLGSEASIEDYTIRGLMSNTLYEVSVKAFNLVGVGPLSSPRIVQSTLHDVPGCPPIGASCKGDSLSGIRVWWEQPPTSCLQAPIVGYSILATPTEEEALQDAGASLTLEVFTTNLEKNLGTMPPSSNISVVVRAYNNRGFGPSSRNIFCQTLDDVPPAPERLRVVSAEEGSFVAVWLPPARVRGRITRYTLYYDYGGKVMMIPVSNSDVDSTWKKVTGFLPHQKVTVWVTASTAAGEGMSSPRASLTLSTSSSYGPFAISSQTEWKVSENSAVTLRCRGIGMPRPTLKWLKGDDALVDDQRHQTLPGGDLHLIPEKTFNYTCLSESTFGKDSLKHRVIVLTVPSAPIISITEADFTFLNVSTFSLNCGRAPILGYKLYHRIDSGEWEEHSATITTSNSPSSVVIKNLPCGSDIHLYAVAWNSQGMSPPSKVLVASTVGDSPLRPHPNTLIEVNSTCVTLRLYAWPEKGCPILYWKVQGKEEVEDTWRTFSSRIGKDAVDIGYCDILSTASHLIKITAYSEAGPTSVIYKVSLQNVYSGWASTEYVQEILMGSDAMMERWIDPHVIAGVVSAILLTAAVVICSCVIFRKRFYERDSSLKEKKSNRHAEDIPTYHLYSPIPTKKQVSLSSPNDDRKLSRPSLISFGRDEDILDPEELCPYATFSAGSMDDTLEYGISLHSHSPTSRDCLEGVPHRGEEIYKTGKDRGRSNYNELEFNYLPSKLKGIDRSGRHRPPSAKLEHPDPGRELEKINRLDHREKREKILRPTSREQAILPAVVMSSNNQSSILGSSDRNYSQQIPTQTLYVGQQVGGQGSKEPVLIGRHARRNTSNNSLTSEGSLDSRGSFSGRLHPPSAFSDSRELSEAECDREISTSQNRTLSQQLAPELNLMFRQLQN